MNRPLEFRITEFLEIFTVIWLVYLMAKIAFIWLVVLFRQNLATTCKDGPGQRKLFISESILNFSLRALNLTHRIKWHKAEILYNFTFLLLIDGKISKVWPNNLEIRCFKNTTQTAHFKFELACCCSKKLFSKVWRDLESWSLSMFSNRASVSKAIKTFMGTGPFEPQELDKLC